jgi:hypothetical protein
LAITVTPAEPATPKRAAPARPTAIVLRSSKDVAVTAMPLIVIAPP